MLGRGKKETSDGLTFQISHQAFSCIICKSIHVLFYKMDKTIASFFYENCISFNVADSSSFARTIEESMRFIKQNPFQSHKVPSRKRLSGELLDQAYRSTEQLAAPILAVAKKSDCLNLVANGHLGPSLNMRPSSVILHAHGTRWHSGRDSATLGWGLKHAHSERSRSGQRRRAQKS